MSRLTPTIALVLLAACQPPTPALIVPPPAVDQAAGAAPNSDNAASATAPPDPALLRQVEDLELELSQLKLVIEEMKLAGVGSMDAQNVGYQPNQTTLDARDVQRALDELWTTVHQLQEGQVDMGEPGAGLFDLENGPLGPRTRPDQQAPPPPDGHDQPPQGHQGQHPAGSKPPKG